MTNKLGFFDRIIYLLSEFSIYLNDVIGNES